MIRLLLIGILALLWLALSPIKGKAQSLCGPFYFPEITQETLIAKSKRSVFRISIQTADGVEVDFGTAFVVFSEQKLFLTAYHVLNKAFATPANKIIGTNPNFPNQEFQFELVNQADEKLKNLDLAFLKLAAGQKPNGLKTLEISFATPRETERVTSLGYTRGQYVAFPTDGLLTFSGNDLIMKAETHNGDSGSPVFDKYGRVIGVVVRKNTTIIAEIQPFFSIWENFLNVAPNDSDFINSLFNIQNWAFLKDYLDPTVDDPHISNLQLLNVFKEMADQPPSAAISRIAYCPLFMAGSHRGLSPATALLFKHMTSMEFGDLGRVLYNVADAQKINGNIEGALISYQESENLLVAYLVETLSDESIASLVQNATCRLSNFARPDVETRQMVMEAFGAIGLSSKIQEVEFSTCLQAIEPKPYVATIFRDLALAQYYQKKLIGENNPQQFHKALSLASLAAAFSESPQVYGSNMALLGDIFLEINDYESATGSYASAWQNDNAYDWVVDNYVYSQRLWLGNQTNILEIGEANQLSIATLTDLLNLPEGAT